jgi:hypothetical protein
MSVEMLDLFEKMLQDHKSHLDRLERWKELGGSLQNYPEGETIDDFIRREQLAVDNLQRTISVLKAKIGA